MSLIGMPNVWSQLQAQGEGQEESDTVGLTNRLAKRQKRAWEQGSGSDEDASDKERTRDQREKEEFEARLKARDEAKTRKIAEAKLSREEVEVGCTIYSLSNVSI